MKTAPLVSATLLFLLGTSGSLADSASFRTPLAIAGADLDARGSVSGSFGLTRSSLTLTASKLDPQTACEFFVDGVLQGTGTTSRSGSLTLRFRAPDARSYQRLDFDPRGKTLTLQVNGALVLSGVFSGAGEDSKATASESAELQNLVPGTKARASARYTLSSSGVAIFSVSLSRVPVAPVTLMVNGQPEPQAIVINRGGSGLIRFRSPTTPPGYLPLLIDPRGATIDLLQNGQPIFTGQMRSRAFGANHARRNAVILPLPAVTTPPAGVAKAKWSVDERARRKFSVELEDAPAGDYDFLVNGTVQGLLKVVSVQGGTEGELEFSSGDDDSDELPLTFDPLGATLALAQGGTTLFEGLFDPSVLGNRPPAEPASRFDETLASTGVDPDAKAEARYEVDSQGRHRFKVEIEDVDVGSYSLRVGSVHRATLRAALIDGTVEGEVEFRSVVEPRKILLNFDPRGQLVEIVAPDGSILFSHILGSGSATGGSGGTQPVLLSQALFAQSGAAGSVLVTYEVQEDGDIKLKLKARQLPAGSYDVSVGGSQRGTLTVVVSGGQTEGELEFETDPDPGQPLLNFNVLGEEISISQGGTVLFSRVLPLL